jgi:L-threonylcarbamoyladenylate synthase
METRILKIADPASGEQDIRAAARALADGEMVVFPTETVYGLGVSAVNRPAIDALSRLKNRTPDKPFTLHLADPEEAERYAGPLLPLAQRLIRKTWPGPLTLVLPDRRPHPGQPEGLAEDAIYYDGTIGLRCPNHAVGQAILRAARVPVIASSANLAGHTPPRRAEEAIAQLNGAVPLIVDSGPTHYSRASTVVRISPDDQYEVLREGAITARRLDRLSKTRILIICTGNLCRSPMAVGVAMQILATRLKCRADELRRHGFEIASAGTGSAPGYPASDNGEAAMAERGIDISGHRSQPMTVDSLLAADYIWVMTQGHLDSVLRLAPEVAERTALLDPRGRPVADPIGGDIDAYRTCARHLEQALLERLMEVV